jgi:hypothetical protein
VENWRRHSLCSVALQTTQRVTCSSSFLFESKRVVKEREGENFLIERSRREVLLRGSVIFSFKAQLIY